MVLSEMQKDMISIAKKNGAQRIDVIVLVAELYKPEMQLEMIRWMLKNPGANSLQLSEQCSKIYKKHHTKQDQEEQDRYWQELEEQDSKA